MIDKSSVVTPLDIHLKELNDILDIDDGAGTTKKRKQAYLKLVDVIFKILKYELSPDTALSLITRVNKMLILACAGAGKTTTVQIRVILEKIIHSLELKEPLYGNRVLCLVYNEHNVEPMKIAQQSMVAKIKRSGIQGFDIDDVITATTIHSFCNRWKNEYKIHCGMSGTTLMNDTEAISAMRSAVELIGKKYKIATDFNLVKLISLYTYSKECLLDYDDPRLEEIHPELNLSVNIIKDIFKVYDSLKARRKKYEFIDMLTKVYELLKTNKQARDRINSYYDLFIADEFQDFTPLMREILKLISGDKKLVLVADEDQSIYRFKGADSKGILRFSEHFESGKVFLLNTNRRCAKNIVEAASYIIKENTLRYDKSLLAIREGGNVELIPYSTEEGQVLSIVKDIEKMGEEERNNLAIGYRDKILSMLLAEKLEEKNIPFNIISGYGPLSHELYGHVISILDFLYSPFDMNCRLSMYKVLPIRPTELSEILGYNWDKKQFSTNERRHFKDIDFGRFSGYATFSREFDKLIKYSSMIGKVPLKEFFDDLFEMFCKYFWNYRLERNENLSGPNVDRLYTERVYNYFNSQLTYDELYKDYADRKLRFNRINEVKGGVTLSTFHGLKGLEFDTVFLTYFDDMIFPSVDLSIRNEDDEFTIDSKESETNACYVGMTRAKDHLRIYYPQSNPSYYIRRLLSSGINFSDKGQSTESIEELNIFSDIIPGDKSPLLNSNSRFLESIFKNKK